MVHCVVAMHKECNIIMHNAFGWEMDWFIHIGMKKSIHGRSHTHGTFIIIIFHDALHLENKYLISELDRTGSYKMQSICYANNVKLSIARVVHGTNATA